MQVKEEIIKEVKKYSEINFKRSNIYQNLQETMKYL